MFLRSLLIGLCDKATSLLLVALVNIHGRRAVDDEVRTALVRIVVCALRLRARVYRHIGFVWTQGGNWDLVAGIGRRILTNCRSWCLGGILCSTHLHGGRSQGVQNAPTGVVADSVGVSSLLFPAQPLFFYGEGTRQRRWRVSSCEAESLYFGRREIGIGKRGGY